MIKTPVTFDNRSGDQCIYDANGEVIALDLSDDEAVSDLIMRVNLHNELVDALKICLACYENEVWSEGEIRNVEKFKQLLEKCK